MRSFILPINFSFKSDADDFDDESKSTTGLLIPVSLSRCKKSETLKKSPPVSKQIIAFRGIRSEVLSNKTVAENCRTSRHTFSRAGFMTESVFDSSIIIALQFNIFSPYSLNSSIPYIYPTFAFFRSNASLNEKMISHFKNVTGLPPPSAKIKAILYWYTLCSTTKRR